MKNSSNQIYHEEEYIGPPPSWLIKKGTMIITLILFLVLIVTSQISYNDTINADVVITTSAPPVYIAPKENGILNEIFVGSGDLVDTGKILAVLQNPASTSHVLNVKHLLVGSYDTITTINQLESIFPSNLEMGSNQSPYTAFITAYQKWINFNSLSRETYQSEGLKNQSISQLSAIANQRKKLSLSTKLYDLALDQYEKQKNLFDKGVISQSELTSFEERLLNSQEVTQEDRKTLHVLKMQANELETAYKDTNLNIMELENTYLSSIRSSRQELLSSIQNWIERFLLVAPISGKVSIFDIWENFQNVQKDDYVFSIVPEEKGELLGKMKVPLKNSGRVDKNNQVIIKLENYPFREWGSLSGKIVHISEVPKKSEISYYSMYLNIDSLTTSFGKKIAFKQEMSGTAEIILEKRSLFERIFYELMAIFE